MPRRGKNEERTCSDGTAATIGKRKQTNIKYKRHFFSFERKTKQLRADGTWIPQLVSEDKSHVIQSIMEPAQWGRFDRFRGLARSILVSTPFLLPPPSYLSPYLSFSRFPVPILRKNNLMLVSKKTKQKKRTHFCRDISAG